jgi:hypothetical protein
LRNGFRASRETVSKWETERCEPLHEERRAIVSLLADAPVEDRARLAELHRVTCPPIGSPTKTQVPGERAFRAAIHAAAEEMDVPSSMVRRALVLAFRHCSRAGIRLEDAEELLRSA